MSKKSFFLTLILIMTLLIIPAGVCSAQDADISDMNKEELMGLLQAVMEKLVNGETDAAETPMPTVTPSPTAGPVQDPDPLAGYDNEELMLLLLSLMNRLDSDQISAAETPEPVNRAARHEIYEIKKLIIERLPEYMFMQPEPDIEEPNTPKKDNTPVIGTVCDPKFPNFCFWTLQGGNVVCVCSELG